MYPRIATSQFDPGTDVCCGGGRREMAASVRARGERFCLWPRMIEWRPDLLAAFVGGKGTADMVRRARAAGVEVIEP